MDTIPIAASFSKSGIKDDWLAAFMMSSILLNPQLMIYSAALVNTALVVRIVTCLLCGILAGFLIRIFYRNKKFFDFTGFDEPKSRDTDPNSLLRFIKNLWRNVKATGLYFLSGIMLSALFQRKKTLVAYFSASGTISCTYSVVSIITNPIQKVLTIVYFAYISLHK